MTKKQMINVNDNKIQKKCKKKKQISCWCWMNVTFAFTCSFIYSKEKKKSNKIWFEVKISDLVMNFHSVFIFEIKTKTLIRWMLQKKYIEKEEKKNMFWFSASFEIREKRQIKL